MKFKATDYNRFVFKEHKGGGLAPPFGVWDTIGKEWEGGTFSTEAEARAAAWGMNRAREKFRGAGRTFDDLHAVLQRAVKSTERILVDLEAVS